MYIQYNNNMYYKLLRPVRPLQIDLVIDWTAETHRPSMHPAAPYAACAINSNAINSTGLGHGGL